MVDPTRVGESKAPRGSRSPRPLNELPDRVNRVAVQFLPENYRRDSRVKRTFTDRSFRHYTTLGCIAPPEKEGRRPVYGFRHLVQALLVRKLL